MKRLKRWRRNRANMNTRILKTQDTCNISVHHILYWRKSHKKGYGVVPTYKTRSKESITQITFRISKLLRNKKHHIPKYKVDRTGLDFFSITSPKAPNMRWIMARSKHRNIKREVIKKFPDYVDLAIFDRWW